MCREGASTVRLRRAVTVTVESNLKIMIHSKTATATVSEIHRQVDSLPVPPAGPPAPRHRRRPGAGLERRRDESP